ncbi:NAD(P)H-binding protein [Nocardia sp. ET3-3]|uniref:NAD(P)H-binding protein n=1 Tax=Nocardia terrae TaxID=2675851 RepID=A0A7K1V173_9NOCA|nr:NmrA family NAD(P)-binding protein [Nocardia terrae]MVU80287.1 NAD(P)H-binding protein [Nocardia terrae]
MTHARVLVTGATGKIGGAVVDQLVEQGVTTRALVHREDSRSARLRAAGAEIAAADMLDYRQVEAALTGVDRVFFNPPYHPHALDSAVGFAVAARRAGVEAIVSLGQWIASPEHPSLLTRQQWLTAKMFELLPDTAHVAVDPGFFADNYMKTLPVAALFGVFPMPTGSGRNAPPSNEDIARVAVGGLLDPHRHDGRSYRPTGPKLLSGTDMADLIGEAVGRRVRHVEIPLPMFMRAIDADAERLHADLFFQSSLRHYVPEHALGTWESGGPTTHVRDVTGRDPEDFLTIARRYATAPEAQRTVRNYLSSLADSLRMAVLPRKRLDRFEAVQQHPRPANPRFSGESEFWRAEHSAGDRHAGMTVSARPADPRRNTA